MPAGGAGDYMFSLSVTIDTFAFDRVQPSKYFFQRNSQSLLGSSVYSDIGFNRLHNTVTSSRSIFLSLKAKDKISIFQKYRSDVPDYDITFCGVLLRLAEVYQQSEYAIFSNLLKRDGANTYCALLRNDLRLFFRFPRSLSLSLLIRKLTVC